MQRRDPQWTSFENAFRQNSVGLRHPSEDDPNIALKKSLPDSAHRIDAREKYFMTTTAQAFVANLPTGWPRIAPHLIYEDPL